MGCARTGPVCTPCRSCYRRGFCPHRGHVHRQSLLYYRGLRVRPVAINSAIAEGCVRTGVMFARVYTLSLLFSPWVMFAPGSRSPACTNCRYCYRRRLCSHRGQVRSWSLLSLAIAGVGNPVVAAALPYVSAPSLRTGFPRRDEQVRSWVMYAHALGYRWSLSGLDRVLGAVLSDAVYLWDGGVTRQILRILLRWVLCVIINKGAGVLVPYVGLRYRR